MNSYWASTARWSCWNISFCASSKSTIDTAPRAYFSCTTPRFLRASSAASRFNAMAGLELEVEKSVSYSRCTSACSVFSRSALRRASSASALRMSEAFPPPSNSDHVATSAAVQLSSSASLDPVCTLAPSPLSAIVWSKVRS